MPSITPSTCEMTRYHGITTATRGGRGAQRAVVYSRLLTAPRRDEEQRHERQAQRNAGCFHSTKTTLREPRFIFVAGVVMVPRFLHAENVSQQHVNPILRGQRGEKNSAGFDPAMQSPNRHVEAFEMFEHIG